MQMPDGTRTDITARVVEHQARNAATCEHLISVLVWPAIGQLLRRSTLVPDQPFPVELVHRNAAIFAVAEDRVPDFADAAARSLVDAAKAQ